MSFASTVKRTFALWSRFAAAQVELNYVNRSGVLSSDRTGYLETRFYFACMSVIYFVPEKPSGETSGASQFAPENKQLQIQQSD